MRILPSLLDADLSAKSTKAVLAEAKAAHVDVMDGVFVERDTREKFSAQAVRSLGVQTHVHLMVEKPDEYFERYAGAKTFFIHVEAVPDPKRTFEILDGLRTRKGLALNPETPISRFRPIFSLADAVLLMSQAPGHGSQTFNSRAFDRIGELRQSFAGDIVVDGGVNVNNVESIAYSGATSAAVGAGIFSTKDPLKAFLKLEKSADR